jgi:hypothetical protein
MKSNNYNNISITRKVLIGILALGLIGCSVLLFKNAQVFIISLVEKVALKRNLNNPIVTRWRLIILSLFGMVSCIIFSMGVLVSPKKIESILDKLIYKTLFGVPVKKIIAEQPFVLVSFLYILYIFKNIFFVIGIVGHNGIVLLLTVLIHGIILAIIYRKKYINPLAHLTVCYGMMIFALIINAKIYDFSYDGRAYHQVAALYLRNNWNPFYENLPEIGVFIWNNHYPKFTEIFNSILLDAFNNIELGKSYNIIFLVIVFCYALKYVAVYQKNKCTVLAISILFVMNPVVLAQIFTYYVDGLMGMLIIILFFSCINYERENDIKDIVVIIAVSIFAINTKFTGFICGVVLIGYIIKHFAHKKYKQMKNLIVAGVIIVAVGVLFIGYNPYITNLRDFGHPFYPLYGHNKIDIITTGNMPDELLSMHPIQRFFSLYLLNYNVSSLPFNPQKIIKLLSHKNYDLRIGGFGVFFAEIFIFVILIVVFSIHKNKKRYKNVFFTAVFLICISLVTPESWWARYIPAFWYLVGFLIASSDYSIKKNRSLFYPLSIIIIINGFSFFMLNVTDGIVYTLSIKQFITNIKKSDKDVIHVVVDAEYFEYAIMEKIMGYGIDKNIVFIEDKETPITNGVGFGNIRGWY